MNTFKALRDWKPITSKTTHEAMNETGLNWSASKRPVHFRKQDQSMRVYADRFVVARDDNDEPLSVTGKNYRPLTNAEAFSIFNPFVEKGVLTLERGGCLGNGISTFLVGTLKGSWMVADQELDLKVAISNDYSGRRSVRLSVIPVVDQFYMPVNAGIRKSWSIWHTRSMDQNLERAQEAIDHAYEYAAHLCEYANDLCQERIERLDAREFFNKLMAPPQNEGLRGRQIREGKITSLLEEWDRLSKNKNTKWGLLQAVSSMELNRADMRMNETPESKTFVRRKETLLKKMLGGNVALFNKAERLLTE